MANHGYCRNCWWWQITDYQGVNMRNKFVGICWFTSLYPSNLSKLYEDSYCPDYVNRASEEKQGKRLMDFVVKVKRVHNKMDNLIDNTIK